jgi:hypothetical protein
MEDDGAKQPFSMVWLADSSDARLFIELSSYASDLAEAREALDQAILGLEGRSRLTDASRHLIGLAVIAYCRTILSSDVRGRLTDHVDVPDALIDVHDQVRVYRNATIAHSQSELATTYAFGVVDSDTLEVRDVMAGTIHIPLPTPLVHEFRTLIDAMDCRLDEVIEPVRVRLMNRLRKGDPTSWAFGKKPGVLEKWASDFNARSRRPPYPTGHTVYWEPAPGGTDQVERKPDEMPPSRPSSAEGRPPVVKRRKPAK